MKHRCSQTQFKAVGPDAEGDAECGSWGGSRAGALSLLVLPLIMAEKQVLNAVFAYSLVS